MLYVPEALGCLSPAPTHCTHAVRVPTSGVPCVARTVCCTAGKTLIASVVMHNFLRWFPTGTVVFMAPTRPLVQQQIGACCHSVGLNPDTDAMMLTGERRS